MCFLRVNLNKQLRTLSLSEYYAVEIHEKYSQFTLWLDKMGRSEACDPVSFVAETDSNSHTRCTLLRRKHSSFSSER